MIPDCIDPQRLGGWLRSMMNTSIAQATDFFSFDPAALSEMQLHWNSCPACRAEFPDARLIAEQVRGGLLMRAKTSLRQLRNEFLGHKHLLLASVEQVNCDPDKQESDSLAHSGTTQLAPLATPAARKPLSKLDAAYAEIIASWLPMESRCNGHCRLSTEHGKSLH